MPQVYVCSNTFYKTVDKSISVYRLPSIIFSPGRGGTAFLLRGDECTLYNDIITDLVRSQMVGGLWALEYEEQRSEKVHIHRVSIPGLWEECIPGVVVEVSDSELRSLLPEVKPSTARESRA